MTTSLMGLDGSVAMAGLRPTKLNAATTMTDAMALTE
jgi:hypothetical protein